jgi:3-hydroxy-9,10-secoandrosta-1,3,5(10)-triene-9,17-dione monooxygenase
MDIAKELIGRAHELQPLLAKRAAATEQNRAPLDETIKDLRDAGFMSAMTPKCFGGHELHVDTLVAITRILATACPSTAWVTSFYMGHNWLHAVFPENSQKEVFDGHSYRLSSGQIAATAKIDRVTGGFEVSGRQSWSSGVVHADYVFFSGLVHDEGQAPYPVMVCIPRKDVEVIDNWFIAGMQGTGSCDVAVEKVFVPDYHAVPVLSLLDGTHPGSRIHANPLYHLPAMAVLTFEVLPVLSGAFRGAADEFLTMTRERKSTYTGASVAAKPAAQMRVGRAFGRAAALDALVDDTVAFALSFDGTRALTEEERAWLTMRSAVIAADVCDGVNDIVHGAGANSFRNASPLQRFFRDLNLLHVHGTLDIETAAEAYGKMKLGSGN